MAVAYASNQAITASAGSGNTITINGVTAGNALLLFAGWEDAQNLASLSDDQGGTWVVKGPGAIGSGPRGCCAYSLNHPGGNTVITASWTGSGTAVFKQFAVAEFSGVATTFAFDIELPPTFASAGEPSTGTDDNTSTDAVIFSGVKSYGATSYSSWAGSATELNDSDTVGTAYSILTSAGARTASCTQAGTLNWAMHGLVLSGTSITPPDVEFVAAGGAVAAATSCAIPYPATEADAQLLTFLSSKHNNLPSTPGGWVKEAQNNDDTGSEAADRGYTVATVYSRTDSGSESGTVTITKTTETGTVLYGQMLQYRENVGSGFAAPTYTTGVNSSTGTSVSVTGSADLGVTVDDVVLVHYADCSDVSANNAWTAHALGVTGCTFGSGVVRNDTKTATGHDTRLTIVQFRCLSGTSSSAPTYTATATGTAGSSHRGAATFVRLRAASGSTALSGTAPASTWGHAGVLAAVAVALSGAAPASTWGHAGVLAIAPTVLVGTAPASTWGHAGALAVGPVALSGTAPASTWGHAGALGVGPVALSGAAASSSWGHAGALEVAPTVLVGTAPASTWGHAGALEAVSAALSGAAAASTWGHAGTLGVGTVALAGTSAVSTWGHAGILAVAGGAQALSGDAAVSTWGHAGTLGVGAVALSGTSPASTWGHAGLLEAGTVALSGAAPASTWGHAGALGVGSVALSGAAPASTWGHGGTLAAVSAALSGAASVSTWGHAGTLSAGFSLEPGGGTTAGGRTTTANLLAGSSSVSTLGRAASTARVTESTSTATGGSTTTES